MPKVLLTTEDRLEDTLRRTFTQQELGDMLGITHGAVSKKLKNMNWSYRELRTIFRACDISKEQIGGYFK